MKNKKPLYILLFMILNFIEWIKGTQDGYKWMVAVNCTGFVMMTIILSAYPVKRFLNRFSGVWSGICALLFVGVAIYWHYNIYMVMVWKYLTGVLNLWWIGIAAYGIWRHHTETVNFAEKVNSAEKAGNEKKETLLHGLRGLSSLALIGLCMAVLMILSASGRLWPVWFLLMFGMFYLTEYTEKDRAALIDGMVDGTVISFFCMQIFAYGFRPYDEIRYKGALANCNMMALYYLIVYCMVLFKIHRLKEKGAHRGWLLFWTFGAGALIAFQFMTVCRTALLACGVVTIVYALTALRKVWKDTWKKLFARGILLAACAVVAFPMVFLTIRWLPTILHHPVWFGDEYNEDRVHSFDPATSWKYVEFGEFWNEAVGRFVGVLKIAEMKDPFAVEVIAKEPDAESAQVLLIEGAMTDEQPTDESAEESTALLQGEAAVDSGAIRVAIWKAYWKDLNWRGHKETDGHYQITEDYSSWHAQNVWLQVAYYYGIPVGIVFVLLTLYQLYYYLVGFLKGKHHQVYGVMPILFIVAFYVFGILETVWIPGQLILCMMFVVQHPMFRRQETQE